MTKTHRAEPREDDTAAGPDGQAVAGFLSEGPHPLDRDRDGKLGGSMEQLVTYLTTRPSEAFGAFGRFVDLKPAAAKPHLASGLLVLPTAEQLAMRR